MELEEKKCDCNINARDIPPLLQEMAFSKIQEATDIIIKKVGYTTYTVNKKVLAPGGSNYLSVLGEVDIKGKTDEGDKETNTFIKIMLPGEQVTLLSINEVFGKEIFFYNELSKIYEELQNSVDLPEEERYKSVKHFDSCNAEMIILENMTKRGFKVLSRMEVVPLRYAELSVQELAKFHALSFILEHRIPKYFQKKVKTMKHSFIFNDEFEQFIYNITEHSMSYLDYDAKKKLEAVVMKTIKKYPQHLKEVESIRCLCHGDYKASNIMMKEINGEITEVVPVDYQFIYYGCPVLDFFYFVFSTTDQKFRKQHLSDLRDLYYNSFTKFLSYFDMDAECIYSRKQFENDYREKMDYGLITGLFVTPFLMVSKEEAPDLTKPLTETTFNKNEKSRERLVGLVDDFIKWGYL